MFLKVTVVSLTIVAALGFARWKYEQIQKHGVQAAAFIEAQNMTEEQRAVCRRLINGGSAGSQANLMLCARVGQYVY